MSRLLVANLTAELAWARATTPGPHPEPSAQARARIANATTWLAAFGRPGDRLLVPGQPTAVAAIARELEVELCREASPHDQVLAWAETAEVAALRRPGSARAPGGPGLVDALWQLAPASATVAARVNHRGFALRLASRLGCALPGSRELTSVAELEAHLGAGGAAASGEGAWVLKAPLAAAGRERLRRRGPLDREARAAASRLFARFGTLTFEPWLTRVRDLGVSGLVGAAPRIYPPHLLANDDAGVFRAVTIDDAAVVGATRATLGAVAAEVAAALAEAGYAGPFTVDAFEYRAPDGEVRLHPLCEINARQSFGLVARALAERAGGRFELRL